MAFNMGQRASRENAETVHDFHKHISDANLSMSLSDKVVLVTLTAANNSTVTLPSVSECIGEMFIIRLVSVGTGAVTIQDKGNDAGLTNITLNAAGQYAIVFSDGTVWANTLFSGAQSSTTITTTGNVTVGGDLVVSGGDIDAGASGSAGSVDVFPATGSKGKLAITCTDQSGNTTVSLVAGAMADARTVTLRDPGAAASILTTTDATAAATAATAVEITQACDLSAQDSMTEAAGFKGAGTLVASSVVQHGGIIKTEIIVDLTDAKSTTTDLDIIGNSGASHIGQITAAKNGTLMYGQMTCLETPATGADDIDLYSATVATGAYDDLVTDLTETALLTSGGAWSGSVTPKIMTALPAANEYLYLTCGEAGTANTYTAGRFLIEFWGLA